MNLNQFYAKLRSVRDNYEWKIEHNTIRAYDKWGKCYCPILAVNGNQNYFNSEYMRVGKMLGLSSDDAFIIGMVADGAVSNRNVRRGLLRATKLGK